MKSANSSSSSRARSGSVRTKRRDRAERVVDEVRADLRAQGAHLGLHQPGARRVELGELELAGDPRATSSAARTRPAVGVRREHLEGADDPVVDDERAGDRAADRAAGRASQGSVAPSMIRVRAVLDAACATPRGLARRGGCRGRPRPSSEAVSVRAAAGVPSSARRWRRLRSALAGGQTLAQGGRGQAGGVQGAEGGPVGLRAQVAAPEPPHGADADQPAPVMS